MRPRFRTQCSVLIARPLPVTDALGGVKEAFSPTRLAAKGFAAPDGGSLPFAMPGMQTRETRALILPLSADIRPRDGVWLEDAGPAPAWRCVQVQHYPLHVRAVLERRLPHE